MSPARLSGRDLQMFAGLGIPLDLLERAQIRRVDDSDARDILGQRRKAGDFSGIEFPYIDPRTQYRVTSRIRRDSPPMQADGRPAAKYMCPYGDNRHLYFPPGAQELLGDPTVPLVFVESEKASLAITAAASRADRSLLAVATGGAWGWLGRNGMADNPDGKRVPVEGPLSDFARITYKSRPTIVMFDARPNNMVLAARRRLGRELASRGADVRDGHLPDHESRVNGPDDLIEVLGDAAFWAVIDATKSHDFRRNAFGVIFSSDLDNIRLALAKLGVTLAYDSFNGEVQDNGTLLDDLALNSLWVKIVDTFSFRPPKEVLRTIIQVEAHNAPFHPVRDYLDTLIWDGNPRLNEWLVRYGDAKPSDYVYAVSALPLIAAVRRVRAPGAKFDELLILESGVQGTQKSGAIQALCPHEQWFSDDLPLGVSSKEIVERTVGKLIIEAADMHERPGRDQAQLKAFLSRQVDGPVRLAYDRVSTSRPRQFVLIGTTNLMTSYLKDRTGGRRFWPVRVGELDVGALAADRDQIWAEAVFREAQGEPIRLDRRLWAAAGVEQEKRRSRDPWEDLLEPVFAEADQVAVDAIWTRLGVKGNFRDNSHAERVARIAQGCGFLNKEKMRPAEGGKHTWHWLRDPSGTKRDSKE